jgi:high-affinity nickel permease
MNKISHNLFFIINYIFKISSLSNVFPSSFDSSFNSALVSISSTKLEKGLQPILRSLGPIFFHKNNLFKLYDCKWHHLKLVSILAKKK